MPSVRIDNVAASEEMTRYLIGLGHRRFAFIAGEPDSPMLDDREIGFRNALAERWYSGLARPAVATVTLSSKAVAARCVT